MIFHSSNLQIVDVFLCRLLLQRIYSELWCGDLLEGSVYNSWLRFSSVMVKA